MPCLPYARPLKQVALWIVAVALGYFATAMFIIYSIAGFEFQLVGMRTNGLAFAFPIEDPDAAGTECVTIICFPTMLALGWPAAMTLGLAVFSYAALSGGLTSGYREMAVRCQAQPPYQDDGIGSRMLWILPILFDRMHVDGIFQPLVADWQKEHRRARPGFRARAITALLYLDTVLHGLVLIGLLTKNWILRTLGR